MSGQDEPAPPTPQPKGYRKKKTISVRSALNSIISVAVKRRPRADLNNVPNNAAEQSRLVGDRSPDSALPADRVVAADSAVPADGALPADSAVPAEVASPLRLSSSRPDRPTRRRGMEKTTANGATSTATLGKDGRRVISFFRFLPFS